MLAVAGGAASTAAVAGSASVDVVTNTTHAYIGAGTTINAVNTGASLSESVAVRAEDTTKITSIAGALAVGGSAGVGVGVAVDVLTKSTKAWIGRSTDITVLGNVTVDANSSEDILSISAGLAASRRPQSP